MLKELDARRAAIDMPQYDGIDYRYTSADPDREKAVAIIANLIGYRPAEAGLDYSLNFYSGGTGVDNRLAIRCQVGTSEWPAVIARLSLKPPSAALSDPDWSDDLRWLVCGEEPADNMDEDCRRFVDSNKHDFQDNAGVDCELLFSNESNVNTWCVVWLRDGNLNYLSFDQG